MPVPMYIHPSPEPTIEYRLVFPRRSKVLLRKSRFSHHETVTADDLEAAEKVATEIMNELKDIEWIQIKRIETHPDVRVIR